MPWHVQYRKDGSDRIARLPSPEAAVEAACNLIDDGCDVFGVGTGPLTDMIDRDRIARIFAFWARARNPFHKIQTDPLHVSSAISTVDVVRPASDADDVIDAKDVEVAG